MLFSEHTVQHLFSYPRADKKRPCAVDLSPTASQWPETTASAALSGRKKSDARAGTKLVIDDAVDDQVDVETSYDDCKQPRANCGNPAVDKVAHLGAGAGEVHQGEYSEAQGERQNNLTQNQQLPSTRIAHDPCAQPRECA